MNNIKGNLWNYVSNATPSSAVCITTNGFVKNNGDCVMGRGCALEAIHRYPNIQRRLGSLIKTRGNHCHVIMHDGKTAIVSFPVKHNWWEEADINLIARSCKELTALANQNNWDEVIIPRPGCGNGRLKYKDVEPVLAEILDDRFSIITF